MYGKGYTISYLMYSEFTHKQNMF